ncbi:hypothetical protein RJ641_030426, partial [Dillenia turbinata]
LLEFTLNSSARHSYVYCLAIDLIAAVKELHGLSSQELHKLMRDPDNFTLQCSIENGSSIQFDIEKYAGLLPLHLIAVLMSSDRDEASFRYLLCGLRLMHSLYDLASRNPKIEQVLLEDVKVLAQILDLVFYFLTVLGNYKQDNQESVSIPLLHSALVACSLYLLTGVISSHWQEIAYVLLACPKVDIFMDVAFGAVCKDIRFLQIKLSAQDTDFYMQKSGPTAEQTVSYLCQQCEASLQFLNSLCQQRIFRERLLRNKEICGRGTVLILALAILKLKISPLLMDRSMVVASVSRLKSKVISILLHLCETESFSYLDEVASSPRSMALAKSVALQVLELLKTTLTDDWKPLPSCSQKSSPMGLLQLNAMRLADIFSDDSNFRSYITVHFTEVVAEIFALPPWQFAPSWCSSDRPLKEEDATLEYDPFAAAGWVLNSFPSPNVADNVNPECNLMPSNMPQASYSHQRTSLFVKVIANLHCFVPSICEEQERNLFLHKFLECLHLEPTKLSAGISSTSDAQRAATVWRNIRSLLGHAEVFSTQLQSLITPADIDGNRAQEALAVGGSSSLINTETGEHDTTNNKLKEGVSENSASQEEDQFDAGKSSRVGKTDDVAKQDRRREGGKSSRGACGRPRGISRDVQNAETSGSDSSSSREKNSSDQIGKKEIPSLNEHNKNNGYEGVVQEDDKFDTAPTEDKQRRKRKRTIMNDKQITLIEKALLDEPDMQRNSALLQSWADKLNNRKARLARAAKDARAQSEGDNVIPDRQRGPRIGPHSESPESPTEVVYSSIAARLTSQSRIGCGSSRGGAIESSVSAPAEFADFSHQQNIQQVHSSTNGQYEPGQNVMLTDGQGKEMARGKIHQVQGKWFGMNLEELVTCVVDVVELKVDRWARLPYPSEATGTSFDEAEVKIGVMRVMWDSNKLV